MFPFSERKKNPPPRPRLQDIIYKSNHALFFLRFLYSELLKYYDDTDDSIFEPAEKSKLQIKPDITFHLYIRWEYQMLSFTLFPSTHALLFHYRPYPALRYIKVSCLDQCSPSCFEIHVMASVTSMAQVSSFCLIP